MRKSDEILKWTKNSKDKWNVKKLCVRPRFNFIAPRFAFSETAFNDDDDLCVCVCWHESADNYFYIGMPCTT